MHRFVLLKSLMCFVGLIASPLAVRGAENFAIDPSHTSVIFGVSHLGYSFTYGRFNEVKGAFVLEGENPSASQFQVLISTASVDTNDAKRDEHLRNADFFNAKEFPAISFQSTGVKVEEIEGKMMFQVTGNLAMHGVTKEITLPLQKLGEGAGPGGGYRAGFLCQTKLMRSDFGMTGMTPMIGDEIAITISFEGVREEAGPSAVEQ